MNVSGDASIAGAARTVDTLSLVDILIEVRDFNYCCNNSSDSKAQIIPLVDFKFRSTAL